MQAWGILACLMLTAVRARSHYVVLIPAELRTDTLENVCVLILSATESSPLTLTIENEMTNSTLLQQELLTNTGYNCFNFTVGNEVMGLDTETIIAVTVRRSGETVSINETKRVVLKRYDSLTFIQTDKAVYKPGQAVKFRIVTLNENFIPIQEKYPFVTVLNLSNGCSKMEILIQPFNLYSRKCAAFFEITDAGTGNLLEKSAECKIVKKITKMAFEDVEQYYKTGIPYRGQIRMQYSTGGPVSNVTIYLFNSMVPGAEKVITDENGIASFSLDTSSWGSESVSLSAMYQFNNKDLWRPLPIHGKARHTAKLFYSRSNSYFSISKHRQELVCDSELDVNVDYIIKALSAQEKHDLDVFYLVMSRGLIVTLKKKTISVGGSEGTKGHLRLSLLINADISPVARLLVFTVLPDGETIGDSAKFQVSKCFRNKVSLHFSVAEDLPKSHVSLDVHAAPDSLCGLRVVDRSVPTPQT
ncbi:alpha-2-macroglobulin-like isoform X1 [Scyliorhinus canicula]|uniref:alpha-2-macroglobulin-like isoform X1 n=1 Tax=Scyliorhinus canicula TaxID=7830 RepID=UPI0018F74AC2|nr:alpha-2-macroglobulin-like isoform X1 [Scyliorhinus canicula]